MRDETAVADRVLASLRGARPIDPAEQRALHDLIETLTERLGPRDGSRRGWGKREVAAALAELGAENPSVREWIRRLAGTAERPARHRPSRRPAPGRRAGTEQTFRQELHGKSTGIQVGNVYGGMAEVVEAARASHGADPPRKPTDAPRGTARIHPRPDLELRVIEERVEGADALAFELTGVNPDWELDGRRFGPYRLRGDLRRYAEELFSAVDREKTGASQEQRLTNIGIELSRELFVSDDLSRLLWELQHRASTLLLRSEEPWIPWELVKLRRPGGHRDGPFLCEAFDMCRWLGERPPVPTLPLRRLAVVAPRAGDPVAAFDEQDDLLRRDGVDRTVRAVPARFDSLIETLAAGGFDGWHLCGHGLPSRGSPSAAGLPLDDYRVLTPQDLESVAGGFGRSRPLLFLNGCHTGRIGWNLTSMGGWAKQAVDLGAGAFLGAVWAIDSQAAAAFAKNFYDRFFDRGMPFAKAVRETRQVVRAHGGGTWLAYAAYGHPLASV